MSVNIDARHLNVSVQLKIYYCEDSVIGVHCWNVLKASVVEKCPAFEQTVVAQYPLKIALSLTGEITPFETYLCQNLGLLHHFARISHAVKQPIRGVENIITCTVILPP